MKYLYVVERAKDGRYSAYVPDLPGCTSCGDTLDELRTNVAEAVSLCIEGLREKGETVPAPISMGEMVEAA